MEYVDFRTGARGGDIGILFPGWKKGEAVAFLSPHDDDAALGAGYLLRAVKKGGGRPLVLVFCKGDAGYTKAEEKRTIVARRRREAVAAYGLLGVPPEDIHFFGRPDLSLMGQVDRITPDGRKGVVDELLCVLRARRAGRVVFTSPSYENWDHTAVHCLGMYVAPQAGDPILADLGAPSPVVSMLVYSVWGDLVPKASGGLGADLGILAGDGDEKAARKALAAFASQAAIMENTVAARRDVRRGPDGWLEIYRRASVREPVNYLAYFRELGKS
jgi:LmbE family N-acetylglucosaminyl deacetylase